MGGGDPLTPGLSTAPNPSSPLPLGEQVHECQLMPDAAHTTSHLRLMIREATETLPSKATETKVSTQKGFILCQALF